MVVKTFRKHFGSVHNHICLHSSAGQSTRLLRESRGIPQREKMKNNFQFESILKNANGDNKAFPTLGNVLMLPNQKNL